MTLTLKGLQYAFVGFFILFILYKVWLRTWVSNPKSLPFPPGPPGLPIIGNLQAIPNSHPWLYLANLKRTYGDVLHFHSFGNHIIYLNSWKAVEDLFEKRSIIYSDRPRATMLTEIAGWGFAFAFMRYGPKWRTARKAFHEFFHAGASAQYLSYHVLEARLFLSRLLTSPDDFLHHVRHLAASTIMRVTYGIEIMDTNDAYITTAEDAMNAMIETGVQGTFMVDNLPILKYIPDWFPGASFQRLGKKYRECIEEMKCKPLNATKDAMARGDAAKSVALAMLTKFKNEADQQAAEELIQNVTGVAYGGGSDTTVSSLQTFFLAMVLHPEVQAKAQAQVDSVIGTDRFPEFDDISSLPYVEAILMELTRWRTVVPLTTAHAVTENDEYEGYFIPKGATVVANAWALLHDEEVYPQSSKFLPERFLDEHGEINRKVRNPDTAAFGFSRRICPGRHIAMNSMIITIASVIAAFNIVPAVDEHGHRIPVKDEMSSGLIVHPIPFKCKITPRSENITDLIRTSLEQFQ